LLFRYQGARKSLGSDKATCLAQNESVVEV